MKLYLTFVVFILIAQQTISQENYVPQTGDLLFQDLDCGDFCEAIEKVTNGIDGNSFSHIGIVSVENSKTFVFEAGGYGVVKSPIDSFLNRSFDKMDHPKVFAGRVKDSLQYLISRAIEKCNLLIGKKYDDVFDINNDKYYCSELVYFAFMDKTGNSLFKLSPMTFIDPDTRKTFPAWIKYFKKLNTSIPEGKPGLNPGGISRSEKIRIVYKYF